MSLFDLAAGLVLVVSGLVGWVRGGAREIAGVAALAAAAALAVLALPFTGPVARHAIHTAWLANLAAILIVFGAAYVVLRVIAAALSRRIQRTSGLSGVDRTVGATFGLARALVVLGLANLLIVAVTPPQRMPAWVTGAYLYPVSGASARALESFAPKGVALARQAAPAVERAVTGGPAPSSNAAVGPLKADVEEAR